MMDCGALPLFVCWWVARVPCGVFFGWWLMVSWDRYVPLVNGGGGGYDLDGHSPPVTLWRVQLPPLVRGFLVEEMCQVLSIGGAVPLCFTRLEVTVRMPS